MSRQAGDRALATRSFALCRDPVSLLRCHKEPVRRSRIRYGTETVRFACWVQRSSAGCPLRHIWLGQQRTGSAQHIQTTTLNAVSRCGLQNAFLSFQSKPLNADRGKRECWIRPRKQMSTVMQSWFLKFEVETRKHSAFWSPATIERVSTSLRPSCGIGATQRTKSRRRAAKPSSTSNNIVVEDSFSRGCCES